MSVAFRRESDEEHLEPKFELPIPPGPNLVTRRGLALIERKVAELEAAIAAADDASRERLKRDLRYWHTRHATAELAPSPSVGVVGIGSQVTIRLNGALRSVTIVGADEADPPAGLLAFQSPLAHALIGGEAGELVDFNGKPEAVEIVGVEPMEA